MAAASASIRPIEEASRKRIVAGQAVFDLASAVKELVDNSLDAQSKCINIRLFNQGVDIVEVSDDGCGVPMQSRPFMASPHATSKIRSFQDIYTSSNTLGFRGEALFCLANLSAKLVIATRTAEEPLAQKMEFHRDGSLIANSVQPVPKKVGTTVAVVGLLDAVPVRRADLIRRIAEQRRRLVRLVSGYAVFAPHVRFQLIDINNNNAARGGGGNDRVLLATPALCRTVSDAVSNVFGPKFRAGLTELNVDLTRFVATAGANALADEEDEPEDDQGEGKEGAAEMGTATEQWHVRGLISRFPSGSSSAGGNSKGERTRDEQLYSINKRPVELPRFSRMLNEVWRSLCGPNHSTRSHPSCILEFTLPNRAFDINVSPDKREVILTHESELLELVQQHVMTLWSSHTEGQFTAAPSLQQQRYSHSFDDEEEPPAQQHNKFNRRYAFSHDIAKIRLQHEFDDGRTRSMEERFETSRASFFSQESIKRAAAEAANAQSDDDDDNDSEIEEPSSQKAPAGSETEHGAESDENDEVVPAPSSPAKRRFGTLDTDSRSPVEDRLWRAAKRRLHESSLSDKRSMEQGTFAQFSAPSSSSSRFSRSGSQKPAAVPSNTASLERFGFRATAQRRVSSVSEPRRSHHRPQQQQEPQPQQQPNQHLPELERPFKRVSFDSSATCDVALGASAEASSTPASNNDAHMEGYDEPVQETKVAEIVTPTTTNAENAFSPTQQQHTGTTTPMTSTTPPTSVDTDDGSGMKTPNSTSTPPNTPLVWAGFSDTKTVVMAARHERLAMRDRRISFHGAEAGRGHSDDDMEEDGNGGDDQGNDETGPSNKISLQKGDFGKMEIVGQFNMGFILAKSADNHLWIMDQHACDEKARFEKLVAETVIHEQPLIAPMPLELSISEESCILDNMEMFEKNGFRFRFQAEAPPRRRLSLTAVPHSGARDGRKAVQFGPQDVSALCAILGGADDDTGTLSSYDATAGSGTGADGSGLYGNNAVRRYVSRSSSSSDHHDTAERVIARLPKAIAMFASRACRSSIMIGKSLSIKEMDRVVKRLGDIDNPWNCPHGRPTMRHAADLRPLLVDDERRAAAHLAGPTVTILTQDVMGDDEDEDENHGDNGQ